MRDRQAQYARNIARPAHRISIASAAIPCRVATNWLQILERLYAVFRVPPFGAPRIRAVKKEQKHYHWDWTLVQEPAARFENLVGSHLLKWVHDQQDVEGRDLELRYFRDTDRREVDFVIVERRAPVLLVECTWTDSAVERGLHYLKARFPACEAWQISAAGSKDYETPDNILTRRFWLLLYL